MSAPEDVRSLYRRTAAGDIGVLGVFCEKATVDTPINGRQLPHEFLAETRAWLDHHSARIDDVRTTATDNRVVHEAILWVDVDGETRELPIMLVADIADGCVRDLRVYHSTWPLCGSHSVRHALMRYDLAERPALARCQLAGARLLVQVIEAAAIRIADGDHRHGDLGEIFDESFVTALRAARRG